MRVSGCAHSTLLAPHGPWPAAAKRLNSRPPSSPMSPRTLPNEPPLAFRFRHFGDRRQEAACPRRAEFSGAVETSERPCDRPGCTRPGKFRAPKSPDNLDDFHWFCLDHVREYNLKWNFFDSHSDADLERQFAADRVWGRPTRPFGEAAQRGATQPHAEGRAWQRFGFDDPMELLGDKATLNPGSAAARRAAAAAADRAAGARDPRRAGHPDQDRDPPAVQGAGQGPASRHERRAPRRRGAALRGGLGLGADQGEPQLPRLTRDAGGLSSSAAAPPSSPESWARAGAAVRIRQECCTRPRAGGWSGQARRRWSYASCAPLVFRQGAYAITPEAERQPPFAGAG